jgi:cation diffusion facilitator CzcD-associated flavoprotein CzcO
MVAERGCRMAARRSNETGTAIEVDLVIVGAGFAGLYMLHRARGLGLTARVFEAGDGVGGTWYWNRYPGARCDTESVEYSYSFDHDLQQEWEWTERYATQPEILRYANHVADRFDLRRDITFSTRVLSTHLDEPSATWRVTTDGGETVTARFVVLATGSLSSTNHPAFDGLDEYTGRLLHTGEWPHEPVDFTGERVAVIGTGSSGIQAIPLIADQAAQLTVFQRTPNYAIPRTTVPSTMTRWRRSRRATTSSGPPTAR